MTRDEVPFDAFLSYAHADADWVRVLAENLQREGLRVFFAEWEIDPATSGCAPSNAV